MRVVIVHYHLKRGGVTRVIENTCRALEGKDADLFILSGDDPVDPMPAPHCCIPELNYANEYQSGAAEILAEKMKSACREHFGANPDLWHIHNHSLGKNAHFVEALNDLAKNGFPILLQIHDFAEDGRSSNYQILNLSNQGDPQIYPKADSIHYALLNYRDLNHLRQAGFPESHTHILPNAVKVHSDGHDEPPTGVIKDYLKDQKLALYPTRGIRRKNLGELLLLSLLDPEKRHYATTLCPKNPKWLEIHDFWEALAKQLELPVTLGLGELPDMEFSSLIHYSDYLLTTSVAEGFGLAFLEPFLFGKPIWGRDLPPITRDFKNNSIDLSNLYSEILVPTTSFDLAGFKGRFKSLFKQARKAYGLKVSDEELEQAFQTQLKDERIDFGRLDETAQKEVIIHYNSNPSLCEDLWNEIGFQKGDIDQVATIESHYSLKPYQERIWRIYELVSQSKFSTLATYDKRRVLEQFLDPNEFRILKQ